MPAKRAIFRARWVLGFRDGGHRLIDNGEVAIEDSRVTYVGPRSVTPLADGVEVREFSEGFCFRLHLSHAQICSHVGDRMMADAGRLEMFSSGFLNYLPSGRNGTSFLAREDPCVGIRYAIGELLKSGITTVVEMGGEVGGSTDAMVDIAGEMGIRAYIAPGFASAHYHFDEAGHLHYSWLADEGEAQFEAACEAAIHNNGRYDDRIRGILVPVEAVLTSRRMLRRTREAATRLGLPITLHVAETIWEFHEVVRRESSYSNRLARRGRLPCQRRDPRPLHLLRRSFPDELSAGHRPRKGRRLGSSRITFTRRLCASGDRYGGFPHLFGDGHQYHARHR